MIRVQFYDAASSTQRYKKKIIKQQFKKLQSEVLIPNGLEIRKLEIGKLQFENVDDFNFEIMYVDDQVLDKNDWLKKVIFIKDKNNISDRTYKSLQSELNLKLPTLHKIRNKIKSFDNKFEIMENSRGVYVDIQNKLKQLIPRIKTNFRNSEKILHIKLSADGAQIIRHKSILNFTFTILNEKGSKPKTATGNYTIGIFDIPEESYDEMSIVLKELSVQIESLNEIDINGERYIIEKYIGGDLKLLAILFGINGATANFPCPWCKWDKTKLINIDFEKVKREIEKEWSIHDKDKGARTIDEAINTTNKFGQIKRPIITAIPFHRIIVDMLHLFLRITDVLYDLFIVNLKELDGYQKNKTDLNNQPHLKMFIKDLKEIYNISAPFFIEKNDIKLTRTRKRKTISKF